MVYVLLDKKIDALIRVIKFHLSDVEKAVLIVTEDQKFIEKHVVKELKDLAVQVSYAAYLGNSKYRRPVHEANFYYTLRIWDNVQGSPREGDIFYYISDRIPISIQEFPITVGDYYKISNRSPYRSDEISLYVVQNAKISESEIDSFNKGSQKSIIVPLDKAYNIDTIVSDLYVDSLRYLKYLPEIVLDESTKIHLANETDCHNK